MRTYHTCASRNIQNIPQMTESQRSFPLIDPHSSSLNKTSLAPVESKHALPPSIWQLYAWRKVSRVLPWKCWFLQVLHIKLRYESKVRIWIFRFTEHRSLQICLTLVIRNSRTQNRSWLMLCTSRASKSMQGPSPAFFSFFLIDKTSLFQTQR